VKPVQCDAKSGPVPVQRAHTANTCCPRVSSAVTRRPPVGIWVHVWPPSWVAHSCGPNAQPSLSVRNRTWLTPVAPAGPWVGGGVTARHAAPPASVRWSTTQPGAAGRSHRPAGTACPITQPVETPTKVTDSGGGATAPAGCAVGVGVGAGAGLDACGRGCCGLAAGLGETPAAVTWRPVTSIPLADTDGNPGTAADPDWLPLITTPSHPEYPAGHPSQNGAAATVLLTHFGSRQTFTLTTAGQPSRTYTSITQARSDADNARVWGGMHYPSTVAISDALGAAIATYVNHHSMQRLGGRNDDGR